MYYNYFSKSFFSEMRLYSFKVENSFRLLVIFYFTAKENNSDIRRIYFSKLHCHWRNYPNEMWTEYLFATSQTKQTVNCESFRARLNGSFYSNHSRVFYWYILKVITVYLNKLQHCYYPDIIFKEKKNFVGTTEADDMKTIRYAQVMIICFESFYQISNEE